MTILAGGVFCAGAFANVMQIDSPALVGTALNQWARLVNDPIGRPFSVLKCAVAQGNYAAAPSSSAKRAEVNETSTHPSWGVEYTYYWRFIIPPDWVNFGGTTQVVAFQIHDLDSLSIARNPPMLGLIVNNVLTIQTANDAHPSGVAVYTMSVAPSQEIEIFMRIKWADTYHVVAALGKQQITVNGSLVYSNDGQLNTYNDGVTETTSPYLKAGMYWPNMDSDAALVGKSGNMYHVASMVGDSSETLATMQAYVAAALAANPNTLKVSNGWTSH